MAEKKNIIVACGLLLVLVFGYTAWHFYRQNSLTGKKVHDLEEALKNSNDSLARIEQEKQELTNALAAAGDKNSAFASELDKVTASLETLERLKKIDPELLQKYSKVYFLNENYAPSDISVIDTKYQFNKQKPVEVHDRILPFLHDLLAAALQNNIPLQVASGYRSFDTQGQLKSGYRVTYGSGANRFSAEQGYSEHQLGTAIDLTTQAVGGSFVGFQNAEAYKWLQQNAHKYGFILSYPPGNAYYVFEPWHWRFVGLDLALKLHNEKKHFYDLDQREISRYLPNFFNITAGQPLP